jgi:hypothetical protein
LDILLDAVTMAIIRLHMHLLGSLVNDVVAATKAEYRKEPDARQPSNPQTCSLHTTHPTVLILVHVQQHGSSSGQRSFQLRLSIVPT